MEDKIKRIIGRNIKAERVRKGLTQENLSEKLNMSLSYISKLEQGRISPSGIVLYRLSRILDVTLEEFFKGVETL